MTTIYVPEGLVNEIGDQVIMDVDESTSNRIEHVRSKAFEQAKKAIDEIIAGRVVISLPAK